MEGQLHVVFGSGQVGHPLAGRLLAQGHRVRVVRRSSAPVPPGAELMPGDAADRDFCIRAASGAAVVYHCMNPPYFARTWAQLVPRYLDNLIAAASAAGARLVVLDNLYMLGRPAGKPLDEDTPMRPASRKGEVRAQAARRLFEAHRRGEVRAVCGRASDYYGPGGGQGTHLGDFFWKDALAGKTGRVLLDPDAIHTYHFIPDVAAGLQILGAAPDDALGIAWMLPCQPAEPLRALVGRMSRLYGKPLAVEAVPTWILAAAKWFVPLLREIDEMRYQWDEPFVVDDQRFRARFGAAPVDRDTAARQTLDWAVATYARGAKPASP